MDQFAMWHVTANDIVITHFDQLIAALFVVICGIACLDIGLTLARHQYRQPLYGLGLGLLAALALTAAESVLGELMPSNGVARFAAAFGIVLLVFMLGQISALAIRVWTDGGHTCPACLERISGTERCPRCGLRMDKLGDTDFIANRTTGELHVKSCHHLARVPTENQTEFCSLEDALWEGYDTCGTCLGGSLRDVGARV
jgi:hypothetical protein